MPPSHTSHTNPSFEMLMSFFSRHRLEESVAYQFARWQWSLKEILYSLVPHIGVFSVVWVLVTCVCLHIHYCIYLYSKDWFYFIAKDFLLLQYSIKSFQVSFLLLDETNISRFAYITGIYFAWDGFIQYLQEYCIAFTVMLF